MAKITRGTKASGGTNFSDNTAALASEVNTDLNQVYTELDAALDNANIDTSADIAQTKIADTSGTAAAQITTQDPGFAGSHVTGSNVEDDIQQLRYSIERQGVGTVAERQKSGTLTDVSWIDTPARQVNLLVNGSFAMFDDNASVSGLPYGWTRVGTSTFTTTTDSQAGDGNVLQVTSVAANDGLSQTIAGLKGSHRYLIGGLYKVTFGDTMRIQTTGASASTQFDDLANDETSTLMVPFAAMIETDSTPTDVVVTFFGTGSGDVFHLANVWLYECSDDITHTRQPSILRVEETAVDSGRIATTWTTIRDDVGGTPADMSITVTPTQGQYIKVRAKVVLESNTAQYFGFRLKEDGTEKDVSWGPLHAATGRLTTLYVGWTNSTPAPGTALTYTIEAVASAGTADVNATAVLDSGGTTTWLEVEVV